MLISLVNIEVTFYLIFKMHFSHISNIIIVLLYIVSLFVVLSESIKDGNGAELKTTTKASLNDYISTQEPWESIPAFKSLWVYRPPSLQSHRSKELSQPVVLKPPRHVTRLIKPLTLGLDPFFNKGYYEPFESRQKPVTLVTLKHRIQPRKMADPNSEPDEVAELQSAFNDISNLWHDVPEVINI